MRKVFIKRAISLFLIIALGFSLALASPTVSLAANPIVYIDFGTSIATGTPDVFGFCGYGGGNSSVMSGMNAIGQTLARNDIFLDYCLSAKGLTGIADWNANKNNCQDAGTWLVSNALLDLKNARNSGKKTIGIMDYCPKFLSYSGTDHGVPKDWDVWESIVQKAFQQYKSYFSMIEVWNEPALPDGGYTGFLDLTGSPYTSRYEAYNDLYFHTARAIRAVDSTVPIGGCASAMNTNGADLNNLLNDSRITPSSNYLNFVSFHEYFEDNSFSIDTYRNILTTHGFNTSNIPIYVDEYNCPTRNSTYLNTRAHAWVGTQLIKFLNKGVGACYFQCGSVDGSENFGIFDWSGSTAVFRNFTNTWKVASSKMALGAGNSSVKYSERGSATAAMGAINPAGKPVALMSNDSAGSITTDVIFNNLSVSGTPTVTAYASTTGNNGENGTALTPAIGINSMTVTVTLPAYSTVGVIASGAATYTCVNNLVKNPGFESDDASWNLYSGAAVAANDANSGSKCISLPGLGDAEQTISGLLPNTIYVLTGYVKAANGATAGLCVKNYGGNVIRMTTTGSAYTKKLLVFATGAANTSAVVYFYNTASSGTAYGDDIKLSRFTAANPYNYKIAAGSTAQYLNIEAHNGKIQYNTLGNPGMLSAQWTFLNAGGGYYKIQNRYTGEQMHLENHPGWVQYGILSNSGALSLQWAPAVTGTGYITFKNRYTGEYINNQHGYGYAECSVMDPNLSSAQWTLDPS